MINTFCGGKIGLGNWTIIPTIFKELLVAVIFHLGSYSNLFIPSGITSVNFFLTQVPRSEAWGVGTDSFRATELPATTIPFLAPIPFKPAPASLAPPVPQLESIARPSSPSPHDISQPISHRRVLSSAPAALGHPREEGLTCLQGPCSLSGEVIHSKNQGGVALRKGCRRSREDEVLGAVHLCWISFPHCGWVFHFSLLTGR